MKLKPFSGMAKVCTLSKPLSIGCDNLRDHRLVTITRIFQVKTLEPRAGDVACLELSRSLG